MTTTFETAPTITTHTNVTRPHTLLSTAESHLVVRVQARPSDRRIEMSYYMNAKLMKELGIPTELEMMLMDPSERGEYRYIESQSGFRILQDEDKFRGGTLVRSQSSNIQYLADGSCVLKVRIAYEKFRYGGYSNIFSRITNHELPTSTTGSLVFSIPRKALRVSNTDSWLDIRRDIDLLLV